MGSGIAKAGGARRPSPGGLRRLPQVASDPSKLAKIWVNSPEKLI